MTADVPLALWGAWARAAVARGDEATLSIAGIESLQLGDSALLHDHNGRPTFIHPAESPMSAAAGHPAILTLAGNGTAAAVFVVGRLTRVEQDCPQSSIRITALEVDRIAIELIEPGSGRHERHLIPVDSYWHPETRSLVG